MAFKFFADFDYMSAFTYFCCALSLCHLHPAFSLSLPHDPLLQSFYCHQKLNRTVKDYLQTNKVINCSVSIHNSIQTESRLLLATDRQQSFDLLSLGSATVL